MQFDNGQISSLLCCGRLQPSAHIPVVRPVDSSGGLLQWTPIKCPLLGYGAPNADVFQPYAAGGTWLGSGLRGIEYGSPRDCP